MIRHVDHLLAAYVEDQLTPAQAAQVYRHTTECLGCRAKLARREAVSRDLRLALGGAPRPHPAHVQAWWRRVMSPLPRPSYHTRGGPLLTAMLAVLALILPLYGFSGALTGGTPLPARSDYTPVARVTALLLPSAPSMVNRPALSVQPDSTALATPPPASVVASAPVVPAPLAPPAP